jgi:hypothetical protein
MRAIVTVTDTTSNTKAGRIARIATKTPMNVRVKASSKASSKANSWPNRNGAIATGGRGASGVMIVRAGTGNAAIRESANVDAMSPIETMRDARSRLAGTREAASRAVTL